MDANVNDLWLELVTIHWLNQQRIKRYFTTRISWHCNFLFWNNRGVGRSPAVLAEPCAALRGADAPKLVVKSANALVRVSRISGRVAFAVKNA